MRNQPMYRKSVILFILSLLLMFLAGCEPLLLKSHWTDQPIVIDGNNVDWKAVPLDRLESWDVSLGLCNDADDLYLLIYFENPMLMMAAGNRGIALEFFDSRTREVIFGLHYTGLDSLAPAYEPEDSFWQCLNADQKKQFMAQQAILKDRIAVTKKETTVKIPPDGSQGLSAARVYHPMFCGYELRIPIRKNGDTPYALGTGLGETVNIKIRMGEQKEKDESFNMSPMGGMSGTPPMDGSGRAFPGGPSVMNEEVLVSIVLAEKH
jgi:hypothetical protein